MRKKGFTLIELIVVIAIIGILAGVLMPSWGAYIRRARTRSQNLQAKSIFTAAQNIVTDMKFAERRKYNDLLNLCATSSNVTDIQKAADELYGNFPTTETGAIDTSASDFANEFYIYWNGTSMVRYDIDIGSQTARKKKIVNDWNEKIADSINRIVKSDTLIYKIYVKDYQVMSVASARFENDNYLGTYPITLNEIDNSTFLTYDVSAIRNGGINNVDMKMFALPECSDTSCNKKAIAPNYQYCSDHVS